MMIFDERTFGEYKFQQKEDGSYCLYFYEDMYSDATEDTPHRITNEMIFSEIREKTNIKFIEPMSGPVGFIAMNPVAAEQHPIVSFGRMPSFRELLDELYKYLNKQNYIAIAPYEFKIRNKRGMDEELFTCEFVVRYGAIKNGDL